MFWLDLVSVFRGVVYFKAVFEHTHKLRISYGTLCVGYFGVRGVPGTKRTADGAWMGRASPLAGRCVRGGSCTRAGPARRTRGRYAATMP